MQTLVFQLQAPMAAWGEPAVGGYRASASYPGKSALAGLLGAALGLRRGEQTAELHGLLDGYRYAVAVRSEGGLLRDYHTSQVPSQATLKRYPHASRRDELNVPQADLNTILSTRDYRSNGDWLVAVEATESAAYSLGELMAVLKEPRFVLYLGRKSCPPAAPLFPQVLEAESVYQAFRQYETLLDQRHAALGEPEKTASSIQKLIWEEGMTAGLEHDLRTWRKDRLIQRDNWQFGDRIELIAMMSPEKED